MAIYATMTVMAMLKDCTWAVHLRLERRLSIKERFATRAAYGAHLGRMFGFYAVAEAQWAAAASMALDDYDSRRKAQLIVADLAALGVSPDAVAALPLCGRAPDFADAASALGGMYVLEGATLGGQRLLPMAERTLAVSAGRGASFFAGYGERTAAMWRRFGAAVERCCDTSSKAACAAIAARSTFLAIEDWLCGT